MRICPYCGAKFPYETRVRGVALRGRGSRANARDKFELHVKMCEKRKEEKRDGEKQLEADRRLGLREREEQ